MSYINLFKVNIHDALISSKMRRRNFAISFIHLQRKKLQDYEAVNSRSARVSVGVGEGEGEGEEAFQRPVPLHLPNPSHEVLHILADTK